MITQDELIATLTNLEEEIDKRGWDAPHFLYAIKEDGTFDLILEIDNGHPYYEIKKLLDYDQTFKNVPAYIGLALSTETWRHVTGREIKEIAKGDPPLRQFVDTVQARIDEGLEAAKAAGLPVPPDAADQVLDRAWANYLAQAHLLPSQVAPHLRGELRVVFTVFRDQRPVIQVIRDRNQDAYPGVEIEHREHADHMGGDNPENSRVPKVVWQLLAGEEWTG